MNNKIVLTNISKLEGKRKTGLDKYDYTKYEVTKRKDFSQCYVCFYELAPLKSAYPKHYHKYNTECFYIISGSGEVETNDEKLKVTSGDIIVFPCGEGGTHKITNTSKNEKLTYIDFDTTNSPDIIKYVDSGKIGIIEHNISSSFYKENCQVDYYDGEK